MKMFPLLALIIIGIVVYIFIENGKDTKARKESIQVAATIEQLRCKQRLKSDKSLVVVSYRNKSYSLFTEKDRCKGFKLNETITVYYSKSFDKLFLER